MERFHVRIVWQVFALLVTIHVSSDPLAAQPPVEVALSISGGSVDPRGEVPAAPLLNEGLLGFDRFDPAWTVGAALDVWLSGVPLGIRMSGTRSGRAAQMGHLACPPGGICSAVLYQVPSRVRISTAAVALTGRTLLGPVAVHPHLGAAWVGYTYRWNPRPSEEGLRSLEPGEAESDGFGIQAGLGIGIPVTDRLRVRGDWSEVITGGGDDPLRTRASRLSSFTLGLEAVFGR